MDQESQASIIRLRGYSTRPSGFPIIKIITESEFSRGYLYVTTGDFLSNLLSNPFDVNFMGRMIQAKTIARGRVIIGREIMLNFARPNMAVRIEPVGNNCLSISEQSA